MRLLPVSITIVAISAIILFVVTRPAAAAAQAGEEERAMYESLRAMALTTSAADLGLQPAGADPYVYGIVMDMDVDGETATIVSFGKTVTVTIFPDNADQRPRRIRYCVPGI